MGQTLMVRVYMRKSTTHVERLLKNLVHAGKLRGVTVIQGVVGVGASPSDDEWGRTPEGDPPVILEFFDEENRARETILALRALVRPHHVLTWKVTEE